LKLQVVREVDAGKKEVHIMRYFDYEKAAREAHLSSDQLKALCHLIRKEFPTDDMLYELHLLRVCMAIKQGSLTIDKALQYESKADRVS
jgi:hypothetical protein